MQRRIDQPEFAGYGVLAFWLFQHTTLKRQCRKFVFGEELGPAAAQQRQQNGYHVRRHRQEGYHRQREEQASRRSETLDRAACKVCRKHGSIHLRRMASQAHFPGASSVSKLDLLQLYEMAVMQKPLLLTSRHSSSSSEAQSDQLVNMQL